MRDRAAFAAETLEVALVEFVLGTMKGDFDSSRLAFSALPAPADGRQFRPYAAGEMKPQAVVADINAVLVRG